jgi:hypothetical protein
MFVRILFGKSQMNRQAGRPRRRWEDNIRMDLTDIGLEGMGWVHMAVDRDQWRVVVNTVFLYKLSDC